MSKVIPPIWQASGAQSRLPELVDAAIDRAPRVVRRPDGRAVVMVAREAFQAATLNGETPRETVKDWMLNRSFTLAEDDPVFTYLEAARSHANATFDPSIGGKAFLDDVHPRHQRRKRPRKTAT